MRIPLLLLILAGCSSESAIPPVVKPSAEALVIPGIENAFKVSDRLYSGGTPETPEAFAKLKALGVSTIISVDGAPTDVKSAEAAGMKYIHLPVSYDGISNPQAYRIAKAVQSNPGVVFMHCHHGRHRGPAAVAAVRLCLEPDYTPGQAIAWMKQAGTDPKYGGLVRLPNTLPRPSTETLAGIPAEFPANAPVDDLTHAMVNIDAHWDALKAAKAKDWLGAERHATLLVEDYREAARMLKATSYGDDFRRMAKQAETAAGELADAVVKQNYEAATTAFVTSQLLCAKCHAKFRDGPP